MTTLDVRELSVEVGGKTVVERSQLHAARRRQDGRRRSQRRRQDQHVEGARRRGPAAARHRDPNGCDRLPAAGSAPASGRRSRHRAGAHPGRARPGGPGAPAREGADPARGVARGHATSRGSRASRRSTGSSAATRPSPRRERSPPGSGWRKDRLALPVRALSGGERRRLELARILFGGSDLLMLDEPTNHLDADAKHWLMKFLASYRGALLVVSHDLGLLDASITRILHLDRDGVVEYRGTYSQYRTARAEDEQPAHARSPDGRSRRSAAEDARGLDARPDRQARAEGEDAGHARREARGDARSTGPTHERTVTVPVPAAAALRHGGAGRRTGWRRATAGRRSSRTSRSTSGGASGC